LLFELYGIPRIIFYISLFISTYFSHGAVITCFTRFQVLTVVQLGIPFLSDVILADGWFLTVSPSLSAKQVLRVEFLTRTNSYNAAAYSLLNNQRYATQYYTLEASRISTLGSASPSTCTGYLHSVNLTPIWKYVLIYALYAKRPCFVSRT